MGRESEGLISEPRCLICEESAAPIFWANPSRTIRRCRNCGLLFVYPQPSQDELDSYFQEVYHTRGLHLDQTRLALEFDSWRRLGMEKIAARIHAKAAGGRLLDIGCAGGALFDFFPGERWELHGIDLSEFAIAHAQERFASCSTTHWHHGHLLEARFPPKSFDVITILQCLYHMANPNDELACVREILKDDGLLVIELPGYIYSRLLKTGPISLGLYGSLCSLPPSHLYYFSPKSLRRLLLRHRLVVVETAAIPGSYYGGFLRRKVVKAYYSLSRLAASWTNGRMNLGQRVLYMCRKTDWSNFQPKGDGAVRTWEIEETIHEKRGLRGE